VPTITNKFTNPSFEVNTTGWLALGAGATLTRITSDFHEGVACAELVCTGAAIAEGLQLSGTDMPVTGGQTYTVGQWLKFPAGRTIRAQLIDTVGGAGTTVNDVTATGDWQFVSVTRTASATTTAMDWRVYEPVVAALTFYADDAVWVEGSALPGVANYTFHGGTADVPGHDFAWTGAAHASTSTDTITPTNTTHGVPSELSAVILADSPLIYWKLDEASGQFQDSSGNARHSTSNSNLTRQSPGLGLEAGTGVAVLTRTSASLISTPDSAGLDVAAMTFEQLVRTTPDVEGLPMYMGGKWGSSGAHESMIGRIAADGKVEVLLRTDTTATATYSHTPAKEIRDGRIHHIAYSYDPTIDTLALYIDGAQVQTWTVAGSTVFVGGGSAGITPQLSNTVQEIDEFAMYGTALSAADIKERATAAGIGQREIDSAVAVTAIVDSVHRPATVVETQLARGTFVTGKYAPVVTADNPLGYWRMNDTVGAGGTIVDSSGGGFNATNGSSSAAASHSASGLIPADVGNNAYSYDGVNDITTRSSTGLYAARSGQSIEAWFKTSTINGTTVPLFGAWGSLNSFKQIRLELTSAGFAQARARIANTDYVVTGAVNLRNGVAHHVVATVSSGDALRLYVDGVEVASTAVAVGNTGTSGDPLLWAGMGSGESASFFTGVLDELAFYGHALSAARVAAHYTTAQALFVSMGTAAETDIGVSPAVDQDVLLDQALETDSVVVPGVRHGAGVAPETDTGVSPAITLTFHLDPALETDEALEAVVLQDSDYLIAAVVEFDTVPGFTAALSTDPATELDSPIPPAVHLVTIVTPATELQIVPEFEIHQHWRYVMDIVEEFDAAIPLHREGTEHSFGQLSLVVYRYTPVSVNVGYEYGSIETFEYHRATNNYGQRTTDAGVPKPYNDPRRP
jgi:hypothetical protein